MIRIANGQGFWGDSLQAPVEQIRRGPIDYLTLDYLAEVTMSILQKQRMRDPQAGYAHDFVELIARVLPDLKDRRVRVIAPAPCCCDRIGWPFAASPAQPAHAASAEPTGANLRPAGHLPSDGVTGGG